MPMEDGLSILVSVISVLVLVALNGIFVAAEFALVRANLTRMRSREFRRGLGVSSALRLAQDLDLSLSAIQFGITVASLVLGWWGEVALQSHLVRLFAWMGSSLSLVLSHGFATMIALVVITVLHVVLGELVAKSIAIRYPERTLRLVAGFTLVFAKIFRPVILLLNWMAVLVLRLLRIDIPAESERVHSSADLALLVTHSSKYGNLDKDEAEMLQGVFSFSDTVAREVMTPRTDMVTIAMDASFSEVVSAIVESGLSRLPVVGESIDDLRGIILSKDLLAFVSDERRKSFSVASIIREPFFIPGTKPVADLLNEMKRRKVHFAIVLDEHGGVDGVVTLEDLLEEIVGDIFDESDTPEPAVVMVENGDALVDGGVLVADLNSRFELEIPEGDYDTIGGFIFSAMGRIPEAGEQIRITRSGVALVNGDALLNVSEGDWEAQARDSLSTGDNGEETLQEQAYAVLTVERVESHRVESVRVKRIDEEKILEPDPDSSASEHQE